MAIIKAKGDLFIRAIQIQEPTERSQMLALNLKTRCTLSDQGILSSEEFLSCKSNADAYAQKIEIIALEIENIVDTKIGQPKVGDNPDEAIDSIDQQKDQNINILIRQSEANFEAVSRDVSTPTVGSDEYAILNSGIRNLV